MDLTGVLELKVTFSCYYIALPGNDALSLGETALYT